MPTPTRADWAAAAADLADRHHVAASLHERHGPPDFRPARGADRYESLTATICYQQLAGAAAATIWGRVRAAVGEPFEPAAVLAVGEEGLRSAGCSRAKALAILDLAAHVDRGDVRLDRAGRMSDEELLRSLVQVRGIGPWTAQMFLLFDLRRLDIWPTGDYGVRAGYTRAFGLPSMPNEREIGPLGDPFAPYRSVLAWWCWREADAAKSGAAGPPTAGDS